MIGIIGISHHTASLAQREIFALDISAAETLVEEWRDQEQILGAIVLSTCNRTEIYYETSSACPASGTRLIDALIDMYEASPRLRHAFVQYTGAEAMQHLFRLASGLESMVLGETQILGQLKDAFRHAIERGHSTSTLSRLFHKAFETAKRIRSRYLISATPISAGASSVDLVAERTGGLASLSTLIVGAGQMAETIYERLTALGAEDIHIYNRTRSRAERFAQGRNLTVWAEDELGKAIAECSVLFVATSAASAVISRVMLEQWVAADRELHVFDLGVPRNVTEDVALRPGCSLYTIDDLANSQRDENRLPSLNHSSIEGEIEEMVTEFVRWCEASQVREVIHVVQEACDALLKQELGKLPSTLSEDEVSLITQYDTHLRVTMSTAIVSALREMTEDGRKTKQSQAIHQLFSTILDKL